MKKISKIKFKILDSFKLNWMIILILWTIVSTILFSIERTYLKEISTIPITDIILSNIPSVDVSWLFTYGCFLPEIILLIFLIFKKNFKTFFYFYYLMIIVSIIRLLFNMMTHLKLPTGAIKTKYLTDIFLENDLFFSGHVALPFLYFLIFWKVKDKKWAYFWLFSTISMAITVLLMKAHYTIDVMAAPFITFTIFYFTDWYLNKIYNINIIQEYKK